MAGTDRNERFDPGPGPVVVLVRPQLAQNIGTTARAMWNFGLDALRLVAPRDGWPQDRAWAAASGADGVLAAAALHGSLPAAIADCHHVYATTARPRGMDKPVMSPREAAADQRARIAAGERVAVLFGAERTGLENDEIPLANTIIEVPANPGFRSINLAQAVLLVGYEWFQAGGAEPAALTRGGRGSQPATAEELLGFYERLEAALDDAGFLFPPDKRPSMVRNIRNVFARAGMTEQEIRTFHGIVSAFVEPRRR